MSSKKFANEKIKDYAIVIYSFHSTPNLIDGQMKSTVSLDARIFDSGNFRTPPVAPPRKKRSTLKKGSTLPTTFGEGAGVRNGFKDVFIGGASKVLKYDDIEYIDKEDNVVQTRAAVESDEDKSPERKLKVGNKKTDKFFGEELSDRLSDVPVNKEVALLEEDPGAVVDATVEFLGNSDKKLFFLMNMLEMEQEEEMKYNGKEPVEEPLFVARKKEIKRHLCDDDDHMHGQIFHKHEKDCDHTDHIVAPPKPDRDFSKYQAAAEEKPSQEVDVKKVEEPKMRVNRAISRENLPTPPDAPKRKSGMGSVPNTPTITIETIEFNTSAENEDNKDDEKKVEEEKVEKKIEKAVKRPPSLNFSRTPEPEPIERDDEPSPTTPTRFHHEIVDRMIKKAYGFHDYHPDDMSEHNHDDGSNLVAPTSKLATRKISVGRKISTESAPSDGELLTPGSPRKKLSFGELPLSKLEAIQLGKDGVESQRSPPKSPLKTRDYEKLLNATSMNDIIEEIYSKNSDVMKEFQSYLEQSIETKPVINVDDEKEFLKAKGITGEELSRTPEPSKLLQQDDEVDDNQSYSDSFESTDTEQETITDMGTIKIPKFNTRRRESIEDVDGWFNNHLNLEQKKSEICGSMDSPKILPGYDMQATFPFGKPTTGRRESLSDEFFADIPHGSLVKSSIGTLRESESSNDDEGERKKSIDEREKSPDHSTLLKYFDKETKPN